MNFKKSFFVVVSILLVLFVVIEIYIYYKSTKIPIIPVANVVLDTSNWKMYKSDEYGFTFKYPPSWRLSQLNKSPITTQKRESFVFKPGFVLFSITVVPIQEWSGVYLDDHFKEVGRNSEYVFAVTIPSAYMIPRDYVQKYEMLLSTFKPK